jgi:hypothetical protein
MTTTNSPEAQPRGCEIGHCQALRSCFHYCSFHHQRICVEGKTLTDPRCGLGDDRKSEAQPQGGELLPCPWCRATSDKTDEWGYLITHKLGCYWANIHGDPIGRVRVNFSEVEAWNTRADLPRATADGPATSYKDKRRLTDAERFKWRKAYNDYTFSNCDHEHDGYPAHLVCAECAFELLAHFAATPCVTGETAVEAALAELRQTFPNARFITISGNYTNRRNAEQTMYTRIDVADSRGDNTGSVYFNGMTLADCMAQVRAAAQTKVEGKEK